MFAEVTGNTVRMGWEEPPHPNGVVLAYEISVRRVDKPSVRISSSKCTFYAIVSIFVSYSVCLTCVGANSQ